jgi:hypothetical protein
MKIYVCHKFGGDPANVTDVEEKLLALYHDEHIRKTLHGKVTFYSPLHATGFLYEAVGDWHDGMRMCLEELVECDAMLVFGEDSFSRGCMMEREYCVKYKIPLIEYDMFAAFPACIIQGIEKYWGETRKEQPI